MGQIIVENGEPEIPAGKTVAGHDLVIVTTPTGFYRVESRGPGPQPAISQQMFTSLAIARRELDAWRRANAGAFAKAALKDLIVNSPSIKEQRKMERQALAMSLKNGETAVEDEAV